MLDEFTSAQTLVPTLCTVTTPHYCIRADATHFYLRKPIHTKWDMELKTHHLLQSTPTENCAVLPQLYEWLEDYAHNNQSSLGRVYVSVLNPMKKVLRHYDTGIYPILYNRYHLVLQSEGTRVTSGEDVATFYEGEVWWFNNFLFHDFSNDSSKERIHVIFDTVPNTLFGKLRNLLFWSWCTIRRTFFEKH